MNQTTFYIGVFHSMFVTQFSRWEDHKTIRWSFKFIILCGCLLYSSAIGLLLSNLPDDSIEYLFSQAFDLLHFFMLVILFIYFAAGVFSAVIAGKIRKTL